MMIDVGGARLFVDVENPGLVRDGDRLREKPVLLLLHGGPGHDHTGFKASLAPLRDVAQLVYYDHRGNVRSEGDDPADWTLARWGDDVAALCDALGIVAPIVLGLSFGGFVAQSYATRHPGHAAKLILMSTAARIDYAAMFEAFGRVAGPEARAVAEAYWTAPTVARREDYRQRCVPFYRHRRDVERPASLAIQRDAVALHFNGPHNEQGRMDFRAALARVECPTLVMAGEEDPIMPVAFAETLAASLPPHLARLDVFPACGHDLHGDDPDRVLAAIRDFIRDGG